VLNYLARRSLVIVTTHDTTIASLLDQSYVRFHFTEHMEDGKLRYDYLLKPGLAHGGNAIHLLEQAAYPPEVVLAANQFVAQLAERHNLRP
jgi:DNA mismatch repair ATPase MutS